MICTTFRWFNPAGWCLCDHCGAPLWDHQQQQVPPRQPGQQPRIEALSPVLRAMTKTRWGRGYRPLPPRPITPLPATVPAATTTDEATDAADLDLIARHAATVALDQALAGLDVDAYPDLDTDQIDAVRDRLDGIAHHIAPLDNAFRQALARLAGTDDTERGAA